jgi:hypothetical protein
LTGSALRPLLGASLIAVAFSCRTAPASRAAIAPVARPSGVDFLESAVVPFPSAAARTRLAVVTPSETRVSIYDNALVALVLDRVGRHDEAGRILESLATLQRVDGGIPFSFPIDGAETAPAYVRSGALAWVGYAAVEYVDAAAGGPAREAIVRMAHRIAGYLAAHQVDVPGDAREGLVTGGEGNFVYDVQAGGAEETFVPGAVEWASVEHNVDTFFFLRDLARVTGQTAYATGAQRIAHALVSRAWDLPAGQLRRGLQAKGADRTLALDCASWGSLFLLAAGEPARAETAFATADARFASRDPATGVAGHRPYASGPVFEEASMAAYYARTGTPGDWAALEAVWPEGSAGVALAALRLGHRERAAVILAELERLRDPAGGLPMMTAAVPFEFDTKPSVAATAWVELVRSELGEGEAAAFLWRP